MSASRRAVIVAGGDPAPADWLRRQVEGATWILAADLGARHALEAGIEPHCVVGDFDSLPAVEVERLHERRVAMESYPADKDKSDLELALRRTLRQSIEHIDIYCAFGGRLDHMLTNLAVLVVPLRQGVSCALRSPKTDAFYVLSDTTLSGRPGDLLTLVAMSDTVDGITTDGLRYGLKRGVLERGSSRGLSNLLTSDTARIQVERGELLVVVTRP